MILVRLHESIAAVCPIVGVNYSARRIDFADDSTPEQRAAAQAVLDAFDPSPAAQAAWEEDRQPERKAIRQAAANAIADNDTFLALGSPTNAQTLAQVRRLTQQNNRIIPRLIQL